MASRNYKYYQPNDKDLKDNYGDCVVRALTKVTGKSWPEAFEALLPYAIELQCMPNSQVCYEKRPTVDRFAKDHKAGTFFLNVANHCVAVVNGIYYDTWDSGQKCLYGYWERQEAAAW